MECLHQQASKSQYCHFKGITKLDSRDEHAEHPADSQKDGRIIIEGQKFIWHITKYKKNITEHNITFEEAATVFLSDGVEIFPDEHHSEDEERFRAVGLSDKLRLLLVCHCERDTGDAIRIISAWKIRPEQLKRLREEYY